MAPRYIQSQCPCCLQVSLVSEKRCLALRRLIRPHEVADLVHVRRGAPLGWEGAADMVGRWLERALAKNLLRYAPDPNRRDLWCPPAATLMRGAGDCDDLAILAASVLLAAGVDAGVAVGTTCESGGICGGHAWVQGRDERGWFLLEATNGEVFRTAQPRYHAVVFAAPGICVAA